MTTTTITRTRTVQQQYLVNVADEIEVFGHYRGGFPAAGTNPACVVSNSFTLAKPDSKVDWETRSKAYSLLAAHLGIEGNSVTGIIDWNDHTPTADVIAVLRAVGAA